MNQLDVLNKEEDTKVLEEISSITGVKYSDEQKDILLHRGGMCILACAGSGKALQNGSGVLTPNGYTPIETLKIGDKVYGEDGKLHEVIGVYPQGKKRVYRVHFSDGVAINCCSEHIWVYKSYRQEYDGKEWLTSTTKNLQFELDNIDKHNMDDILCIPVTKPIEFETRDLPVDPYIYGMRIDGGNLSFIQEDYKLSTIKDREKLLQGIVKAIGKETNTGYEVESSSETLLNDIRFICETLGYITLRIGDTLRIQNILVNRAIKRIEETGEFAEMTCIMVDSPSHTFITENCVVTHNTTILTHLIAKRIKTLEIQNTDTLLCTTYSKGGASEMGDRLTKLLKTIGIRKNIEVKTMHSLYLGILEFFGYPSKVVSTSDRVKYIKEACKESEVTLDDEDFQSLDSLLSYQVNNLLGDADLVQSYTFTIDMTLEQYSSVRKGFAARKIKAGVIDFDDMQLYVYSLLYGQNRQDVLDYCRSKWTDIYVDEAQDMSRIQYVILKKMLADPNKLVIIGDDDQCLIGGTKVETLKGVKNIEDIKIGDYIRTANGKGDTGFHLVDMISSKQVDENIVVIKTSSGHKIKGTKTHIAFAESMEDSDFGRKSYTGPQEDMEQFLKYLDETFDDTEVPDDNTCRLEFGMLSGDEGLAANQSLLAVDDYTGMPGLDGNAHVFSSDNMVAIEELINGLENDLKSKGISVEKCVYARLSKGGLDEYNLYRFGELEVGMHIPVKVNNEIVDTVITSIEYEKYTGKVYDLSVPVTRNFIANGVVVHNCIYQWRGADPSIILNICAEYDIQRFVLSTNYRCAGEIVKHAAVGIKFNSRRSDKEMQPYREGGEIKVCDCGSSNLYTMSKYAYKHIKGLVVDKKIRESDIAVLSRNNNHLSILGNMLFKDGIHCDATKEMKMTKLMMYSAIKNVLALAEDSYNHTITAATLFNICIYLKKTDAYRLSEIQKNSGVKTSDLLGYMLTRVIHRTDIEWNGGMKVNGLAAAKFEQIANSWGSQTVENLVLAYKLLTDPDLKTRATGLLALFLTATEFRYRENVDRKRTVEGLVDYISDLIRTMGFNETKHFLKISEQYEEGRMAVPGPKVCMSTMHGSKGKEWDNVVLFADDNVTFPSFSGIVRQLKSGVATSDIYYGIDENRRLHYVAMTRAKKNLSVFTDRKNVGVYLLEALGVFNFEQANNTHIISMSSEGIYDKLTQDAGEVIFGQGSKYRYDIDISDISGSIEIDYLYKGDTSGRQTINIDDIQTGAPSKF